MDKMGGKVEQIYLKYFDVAKMRGKVGTLIRDKMNRLHVLHYYRLLQIRGLIQNIWNLIFSDFDSTFLILGGVCEENA